MAGVLGPRVAVAPARSGTSGLAPVAVGAPRRVLQRRSLPRAPLQEAGARGAESQGTFSLRKWKQRFCPSSVMTRVIQRGQKAW